TDLAGVREMIDVKAVTAFGGDAAGRSMWLFEIALILEIGHGVSDGRRAQPPVNGFGQSPGSDRLTGIYVGPDDQFQDFTGSFIKPAIRFPAHRTFYNIRR